MTYDNTNKGTLGKARERKNDRSPEYTGKLNVEGREYWLSGWVKTGKDGSKFFSLAVTPKDKAKERPAEEPFNDDIPF